MLNVSIHKTFSACTYVKSALKPFQWIFSIVLCLILHAGMLNIFKGDINLWLSFHFCVLKYINVQKFNELAVLVNDYDVRKKIVWIKKCMKSDKISFWFNNPHRIGVKAYTDVKSTSKDGTLNKKNKHMTDNNRQIALCFRIFW